MASSRFSLLEKLNDNSLFNKNSSNSKQYDIYEILKKIYKYLKTRTDIFGIAFPYIIGGYALFLYGYDEIMIKNPIIGTNDIDLHINSLIDTPDYYNNRLQTFTSNINRHIKPILNKKVSEEKTTKWYFYTSTYLDITYSGNYQSLDFYKEYYLENGKNEEEYTSHILSNKENLLPPIEFVQFNCIHMLVLVCNAFNDGSVNNRVPKTLKILKRVLMIYNPDDYNLNSQELDEHISELIKTYTKKSKKENKITKITALETLIKYFKAFYISFISKRDNPITRMFLFLVNKYSISKIQNAGGSNNNLVIENSKKHLLDKLFYNDVEIESLNKQFIYQNKLLLILLSNIINNTNIDDILITVDNLLSINLSNDKNSRLTYLPNSLLIKVQGGYLKKSTRKRITKKKIIIKKMII